MSLEMVKQNARSLAEIIDSYNSLVTQQIYFIEKGESQNKILELNAKITQLKLFFLKLVASIDSIVKEEQRPIDKMARK